jgi:hypothetical protein
MAPAAGSMSLASRPEGSGARITTASVGEERLELVHAVRSSRAREATPITSVPNPVRALDVAPDDMPTTQRSTPESR